jgi:hypothetical protein
MEKEQKLYKQGLGAIKQKNYEEALPLLKQVASLKGEKDKRSSVLYYALLILEECETLLLKHRSQT